MAEPVLGARHVGRGVRRRAAGGAGRCRGAARRRQRLRRGRGGRTGRDGAAAAEVRLRWRSDRDPPGRRRRSYPTRCWPSAARRRVSPPSPRPARGATSGPISVGPPAAAHGYAALADARTSRACAPGRPGHRAGDDGFAWATRVHAPQPSRPPRSCARCTPTGASTTPMARRSPPAPLTRLPGLAAVLREFVERGRDLMRRRRSARAVVAAVQRARRRPDA